MEQQVEVLARLLTQQMALPNYKVMGAARNISAIAPHATYHGPVRSPRCSPPSLPTSLARFYPQVMVFLPTARQTGYLATLFGSVGVEVLEIHSRKSQAVRTKTSDQFRAAKRGIMFSSDVTARGMDYPDVTLVIQLGLTTREQYTHRLGRTARAGKEGAGLLLCAPFELPVLQQELRDMPLVPVPVPVPAPAAPGGIDVARLTRAQSDRVNLDSAKMAWGAWLGFYNSHLRKLRWSTGDLVRTAEEFAHTLALDGIPALPRKTIGKMGLKGVAGLKIEEDEGDLLQCAVWVRREYGR